MPVDGVECRTHLSLRASAFLPTPRPPRCKCATWAKAKQTETTQPSRSDYMTLQLTQKLTRGPEEHLSSRSQHRLPRQRRVRGRSQERDNRRKLKFSLERKCMIFPSMHCPLFPSTPIYVSPNCIADSRKSIFCARTLLFCNSSLLSTL